jgi:hypothetical protein
LDLINEFELEAGEENLSPVEFERRNCQRLAA